VFLFFFIFYFLKRSSFYRYSQSNTGAHEHLYNERGVYGRT